MTHPINIKGGAALDWTREHPGKELASTESDGLRLRYSDSLRIWEFKNTGNEYNDRWDELLLYKWVIESTWTAPRRVLPPTPDGYWWKLDEQTGEPLALVSELNPGRTVLKNDDDLIHRLRHIALDVAIVAEYQGRVKP